MVALMPTEADAKRLRLSGGESADQLHVTLFYLGEAADFSQDDRISITNQVMDAVTEAGPVTVTGRAFGVNHWNGDGDSPCWVLGIGDVPADDRGDDSLTLEMLRATVSGALDGSAITAQHTPWTPHICMAYTGDLSLTKELQRRLGTVEFDRVRVAFAGEYTDIPLSGSLTAAAGPLRRNLTDTELSAHTDFVRMQTVWEDTVDAVIKDLEPVLADQRESITAQVGVAARADDLDALEQVTVDEEGIYQVLFPHLLEAAQTAGEAQQAEAEAQGVKVPEWSLTPSPEDAVTAAVGRDLLDSVARVTARLMSTSLVQSAVRRALQLFGRGTTPELVTQGVEDHLDELTDAQPREAIGGAVTQAQNEGRRTVLAVAPTGRYFASEVLDRNSCQPCRDIDGTEYSSLGTAMVAYPSGGYRNCLGGSRCRGTIVTVWSEPAGETASAGTEPFHGNKGDPGYHLLHPGKDHPRTNISDFLDESQEDILVEDMDAAMFAGFTNRSYNPRTDPGSSQFDPDEELGDDERDHVDWEGLSRYYASGEGDTWFGDFEDSRKIRRAANELAGLDTSGHDLLLGEGDTSDFDRVNASVMLMGLATSPPIDQPLYRGTFVEGGDADEIEASLRESDTLDFSLISFTNSQGVADPSMYQGGESRGGTQIMFTLAPGAQGILGHPFPEDMRAGDAGAETDYDEIITNFSPTLPREVVTGGRLRVTEVTRDGNVIRVSITQEHTYNPVTGRTT